MAISKFRSSDNVDFLVGLALEVCIANIGTPEFELVEFRDEGNNANTPERDTTLEYTLSTGTAVRCPSATSRAL